MTANGHLVAYTTGGAILPWNPSQEVGMIKLSGTIVQVDLVLFSNCFLRNHNIYILYPMAASVLFI